MTSVWRTVQFFISITNGISEVQVDGAGNVRCSCNVFNFRSRCKHTAEIKAFPENTVIKEVPKTEAVDPVKSPEKFRDLVLRYGRVKIG
jgi:hypothetical protein